MNDTSLSQFLKDVEAASYASADDIPRLMKQARENDEERMRGGNLMAASMTSSEWRELERLSRKAAWDEKDNRGNQNNYDHLIGVSIYASRMME